MFLERATRVYRSFRTEYLKLLGFFLALALGPWVGVQGFVYWNVNREQDPPFELPNGCLCLVLYVLTLFMISNTDSFAAFATWVIASVATILGHWVVLWAHDKSGRTPESKSELVLPYLVVTAVLSLLLVLPVCDLLLTSCFLRGESGQSGATSARTAESQRLRLKCDGGERSKNWKNEEEEQDSA